METATKQDIADLQAFIESRLRELVTRLGGSASSPRYLTVEQCAAHIGRTPIAVYGLVRRGEIPHLKFGRKLQFDRERIDRWMERHGRRGHLVD